MIDGNQLENVCRELQNRITYCSSNDAGHVENLQEQ